MRIIRAAVALGAAAIVMAGTTAPAGASASSSGWLDPTFGRGGVVLVPRGRPGTDAQVMAAIASAPSGRVYVQSWRGGTASKVSNSSAELAEVDLAAITSGGHVDGAFHGGHPIVLLPFSNADPECCDLARPGPTLDGGVEIAFSEFASWVKVERFTAGGTRSWTNTVAPAMSGEVTLAGGSARIATFDFFAAANSSLPLVLRGVTPTGQPDTRVGPGGSRTLAPHDGLGGLVRDDQNRLYVVGAVYDSEPYVGEKLAIERLSGSGDPDLTYGSGGLVTLDVAGERVPDPSLESDAAMRVGPDGSLYLVGTRPNAVSGHVEVTVRKLTPGGALDNAFGRGGVLVMPAPSGSSRFGAMTVDRAGHLVVSFADRPASGPQPYLARFDAATGALDRSFGRGGMLAVSGFVIAMDVTGNGKLLTLSRTVRNGSFVLILARRTM